LSNNKLLSVVLIYEPTIYQTNKTYHNTAPGRISIDKADYLGIYLMCTIITVTGTPQQRVLQF